MNTLTSLYVSPVINSNMRCIEILGGNRSLMNMRKINSNMRCIEMSQERIGILEER